MKKLFLKLQLRRQGVPKEEVDDLSTVAKQLETSVPRLTGEAKARIAKEVGFRPLRINHLLRYSTAGAFATLLILVFVAQSAQPGSVLYALKRGTEEVRVIVQPGFDRDDVQQRREDEKNEQQEDTSHMDDDNLNDNSTADDSQKESKDDSHQIDEKSEDAPEFKRDEPDKPDMQELRSEPESEDQKESEVPKTEDFPDN